jgi:pimeloyl-ACP methyl ester carboxylesterase
MATAESVQKASGGKKETSTFWKYLTWSFASPETLKNCEQKILSYIKRPLRFFNVNLENGNKIWTLTAAPKDATDKIPLVLLHGMGSALGFWVMNLDEVGQDRPVHAIDILGFGRSSRTKLTGDAMDVEKQMVRSIEKWRQAMGLEKMILLGHSMGGYLAASYAIDYPDRIQHLIFADAWGFPEPSDKQEYTKFMPRWVQVVERVFKPNPMIGIRAAGPWGPHVSLQEINIGKSNNFPSKNLLVHQKNPLRHCQQV